MSTACTGRPTGIQMFGVEAVSPAPQGEANFKAQLACAEAGITHIECLWNLEAVVGQGRFKLIAFPLRIRGGTASPCCGDAGFLTYKEQD
jgi:kynurenine formamidase